jgi:type VI protein secretion system component Hcp
MASGRWSAATPISYGAIAGQDTDEVVSEYTLGQVLISGYSTSASAKDGAHESISLNFNTIQVKTPGGRDEVRYNVRENKLE